MTLGAVVGKLTPIQLVLLAILEVVFATIAHYIGAIIFMVRLPPTIPPLFSCRQGRPVQASDSGWAMYAHVFGAFFGLAVSRLTFQQHHVDHPQAVPTYSSDIFAIIGSPPPLLSSPSPTPSERGWMQGRWCSG